MGGALDGGGRWMGGHWMGGHPLGLELTEAAEGGRAACTAVVDIGVGGSEKSARGGWRAGRARHVALGCETIHVRLWHLGTLGTVESCYLFVVIDGVLPGSSRVHAGRGGEVAHAAARYNFSRYGNSLYKRLVRHTEYGGISLMRHVSRVMVDEPGWSRLTSGRVHVA